LNHLAANDPRELWVTEGTHDEIRLLVDTVEDVSQQAVGSAHDLSIFSMVESPVLRWYLRDFYRLQMGAAVPLGASNDVVISPLEAQLALDDNYIGSDFRLLQRKSAATQVVGDNATRRLDTLRQWLFHESNLPVDELQVIVWVRSNLVNP
jgi:hypothetical protein